MSGDRRVVVTGIGLVTPIGIGKDAFWAGATAGASGVGRPTLADNPDLPVQVVGGLSIEQAKRLAKAGLRAFVISGNMGLPDGKARYNLPPAEIERLVADFIAQVSGS